jgi:hypothetical protein
MVIYEGKSLLSVPHIIDLRARFTGALAKLMADLPRRSWDKFYAALSRHIIRPHLT